jgi:hypothetical protein
MTSRTLLTALLVAAIASPAMGQTSVEINIGGASGGSNGRLTGGAWGATHAGRSTATTRAFDDIGGGSFSGIESRESWGGKRFGDCQGDDRCYHRRDGDHRDGSRRDGRRK